jgi:hypothetical protein
LLPPELPSCQFSIEPDGVAQIFQISGEQSGLDLIASAIANEQFRY